jgi:hypothetical protein
MFILQPSIKVTIFDISSSSDVKRFVTDELLHFFDFSAAGRRGGYPPEPANRKKQMASLPFF